MERRCSTPDQLPLSHDNIIKCQLPSLNLDDTPLVEAIVEWLCFKTASGNIDTDDVETDVAAETNVASDDSSNGDGEVERVEINFEPHKLVEASRCDTYTQKEPPTRISIADALTNEIASHHDISSIVPRTVFDVSTRAGLWQKSAPNVYGWKTSVRWIIDAKKLQTKDNVIVSPSFEIAMARPMVFRMMLLSREVNKKKGGHCFKKARGAGSVQLKCETGLESSSFDTIVTFSVSTGNGMQCGPVTHDFANAGVCGLPADGQLLYFCDSIDASSQTFSVELEAWTARR